MRHLNIRAIPGHRCIRYWRHGVPCPFHRPGDAEDPEKDQAKRAAEKAESGRDALDDIWRNFAYSSGFKLIYDQYKRKILGGDPREVPAQPPVTGPLPDILPFPNREPKRQRPAASTLTGTLARTGIAAAATLLTIEGMRRLGSKSSASGGRLAGITEGRVATQFRSLMSGSPGQGAATFRGSGRGFFVNDAANLNKLMGIRGARRLRRKDQDDDGQSTNQWIPYI